MKLSAGDGHMRNLLDTRNEVSDPIWSRERETLTDWKRCERSPQLGAAQTSKVGVSHYYNLYLK